MISAELLKEMIAVRHHLHRNPELSFEEWETSAYIKKQLSNYSICYEEVAKTGIIATVTGGKDGKNRLIRADIDALPIVEASGVSFSSKNGSMHACGHDIHCAVLLGTLIWLSQNTNRFSGTVVGVFQPGEERSPGGASLILSSGALDKFNIDEAYALHTAHDMEVGYFGVRIGEYMASTSEMRITVNGEGGHAALTSGDDSSITIAARIALSLREIEQQHINSVVAIGKFIADGTTNIIPNNVLIEGTLRAMTISEREKIKSEIKLAVKRLSLTSNVSFSVGYPPVYNNEDLSVEVISKLKRCFGDEKIVPLNLRMTADDFGFFAEKYKSFYYRLGVKVTNGTPPLPHTPYFIADDSAIKYGIESMIAIIC